MRVVLVAAVAATQINVSPDFNFLGMSAIQALVNGLAALVFLILAGIFIYGIAEWGGGRATQSPWQMTEGKARMAKAAVGECILGGAAAIVNFWFAFGAQHIS